MKRISEEDIRAQLVNGLNLLQKILDGMKKAPDQDRLSYLLDSIAIIRTLKYQLDYYEKFLSDEEIQHVMPEDTAKKIRDSLLEVLEKLITSTLQIVNEIADVEVKTSEEDILSNLLILTFKRMARRREEKEQRGAPSSIYQ